MSAKLVSGRERMFAAVCCAAAMMSTAQAGGVALFVDDDAPPGGDGASWSTAYRFLQDALDAAAALPPPVEIRIGQGVYHPDDSAAAPDGTGDPLATFTLTEGLQLTGGFAGLGAPDPDARDVSLYESVLSGDLLDNDVPDIEVGIEENSHHICTAVGAVVLDGLILERGRQESNAEEDGGVAVLLVDAAALQMSDCTMRQNYGATGGLVRTHAGAVEWVRTTVDGRVHYPRSIYVTGAADIRLEACTQYSGRIWIVGIDATFEMTGCSLFGVEVLLSSADSAVIKDTSFVPLEEAGGPADELNPKSLQANNVSSMLVQGCIFRERQARILLLESDPASVVVERCVFEPASEASPVELHVWSESDPIEIRSCTFSQCFKALKANGAVRVTDCEFFGNLEDIECNGDIHITRCVFTGGVDTVINGAFASLIDCSFLGNNRVLTAVGSPFIARCVFASNLSEYRELMGFRDGSPTLVGCRITVNFVDPDEDDAALMKFRDVEASIVNCTIAWNYIDGLPPLWVIQDEVPQASVRVANSVFHDNGDPAMIAMLVGDGASVSMDHVVVPISWEGPGSNIIVNPNASVGGPTYPPPWYSPCVDAGDNTLVPRDAFDLDGDGDTFERIPLDLAGTPRFQDEPNADDDGCGAGPIVDIGAFEVPGVPDGPVFPEDLDGDGLVGAADLAALLANWGAVDPAACSLADLDGDNLVGPADLATLLARFSR